MKRHIAGKFFTMPDGKKYFCVKTQTHRGEQFTPDGNHFGHNGFYLAMDWPDENEDETPPPQGSGITETVG